MSVGCDGGTQPCEGWGSGSTPDVDLARRRLASVSLHCHRHPEADSIKPGILLVADADGGAAVRALGRPRPAAHHELGPRLRPLRIVRWAGLVIILVVPVVDPLIDVSVHV